jgi:hypothetical protein
MTYLCRYRHADRPQKRVDRFPRLHDPVQPPQDATPPALEPVQNGSGIIIAYRCPCCLRSWDALGDRIGERGTELVTMDAKARRAAMVEALK